MSRFATALAVLVWTAAAHAASVGTWQIRAEWPGEKGPVVEQTEAWVYAGSQWYKGTIYAIGPYTVGDRSAPVVPQLADIPSEKSTLILDGGFYADAPYKPAGLLMVNGLVASPLSFARNEKGLLKLGGILCQSVQGRFGILDAEKYQAKNASVTNVCRSAVQAGPVVVHGGDNAIHPAELALRPYTRAILGFDKHQRPVAVIFSKPVHLYVAAEFLRAAPKPGANAMIMLKKGGDLESASAGLGVRDAINLDGDTDALAVYSGKTIYGNARMVRPSAILLRSR